MLQNEVPQDNSKLFEGGKKAMYAVNESGEYIIEQSSGWEVEEFATNTAVEEFNLLTDEAKQRYLSGAASPIEYLMYKNRMDLPTLASIVKMFSWRIKRHFKPSNFDSLGEKILLKYADAFGVSVENLKNFRIDN
ncbi:MAG: hypothetical protein PHE67_11975 [Campylobacterales bacterium]|nr:hypothetical protein [Campylobacterales bacterium]